ncbi:MAG: O-antigen ligase family protein [Limisphaerales bacterium]
MLPQQLKALIGGSIALGMALFLGYAVAKENYFMLVSGVMAAVIVYALVSPGYSLMLALAILSPLNLPLPFVWNFPFVLLMLGLCFVKYGLQRALAPHTVPRLRPALTWLVAIFFAWVAIRYAMDPVLPGVAVGRGNDVTGFRAYLNFFTCLFLLVTVSLYLGNEAQAASLVRSMVWVALAFVLVLVPLTLTKSMMAMDLLTAFGMYVAMYDNGWLRFVVLGLFGQLLVAGAMLPALVPIQRKWLRFALFGLGMIGVLLSGNRTSVVMVAMLVISIAFLRRQRKLLAACITGVVVFLAGSWYVGEHFRFSGGVGLYRFVTLVSGRAAEMTDAAQNVQWRRARWERAWYDIQREPWVGLGYGGLQRAFVYSTRAEYEAAAIEIDVAAGSIHNGYLASARALGVPAALLFVLIVMTQGWREYREIGRWEGVDAVRAQLHMFTLANLLTMLLESYVGHGLNNHVVWLLVGMGISIRRFPWNRPLNQPSAPDAQPGTGPIRGITPQPLPA